MKRKDLAGLRFGKLVVQQYRETKNGKAIWRCLCDCGNVTFVSSSDLLSGNTKSCGCAKYSASLRNIRGVTRPPINIIGKKFGRLTVLSMLEHAPNAKIFYLCKCDCGKEKIALGDCLRNGRTRSCGCLAHEVRVQTGRNSKGRANNKVPNLVGKRFSRLLVIERDFSRRGNAYWRCLCDCGKEVVTTTAKLQNGHSKSCGCLGLEHATKAKIKHGMTHTSIYHVFHGMHARCENPNIKEYRWYGAKGVSVCKEWQSFESFFGWAMTNGYAEGLTIDRINPKGNYEPSNCRWIARSENSRRVIHKKKH